MAKGKNINLDNEFPGEVNEVYNDEPHEAFTGDQPMGVDEHAAAIETIPGNKNFDRLVHDDQGNVREAFTREGVGEVTRADAENVLERLREGGIYTIQGRGSEEDRVYDVYKRGVLLISGAALKDLNTLL